MATRRSVVFPPFVFFFSLLLVTPAFSQATLDHIASTVTFPESVIAACSKTRDANVCRHSLHAFLPQAPPNPDKFWVLDMLMQLLKKNLEHVKAVATAQSHQRGVGTIASALTKCASDDYGNALVSLNTARQKLASRDLPGIKAGLEGVLTQISFCDQEFAEIPGTEMLDYNAKVSTVCQIGVDLATTTK